MMLGASRVDFIHLTRMGVNLLNSSNTGNEENAAMLDYEDELLVEELDLEFDDDDFADDAVEL